MSYLKNLIKATQTSAVNAISASPKEELTLKRALQTLKGEKPNEVPAPMPPSVTKKVIEVPYYMQPTDYTCQSTVCKMVVNHLLSKGSSERLAVSKLVETTIYNTINFDPNRPDKSQTNSWANMIWWMNKYIPHRFVDIYPADEWSAIIAVKKSIDNYYPVIAGVTHSRNAGGHVILVVGYEESRFVSDQIPVTKISFICHDPYGHYYATGQRDDKLYGAKRDIGGMSFREEGHSGPGAFVKYVISGIKREREKTFQYITISPEQSVSK